MHKTKKTLCIAIIIGLTTIASATANDTQIKNKPLLNIQSVAWDPNKSTYQGTGTATLQNGTIDIIEYFLNDNLNEPGQGTALAGISGFSPLQFNFSIRASQLKSGDNTICFNAKSSMGIWSDTLCITATK